MSRRQLIFRSLSFLVGGVGLCGATVYEAPILAENARWAILAFASLGIIMIMLGCAGLLGLQKE